MQCLMRVALAAVFSFAVLITSQTNAITVSVDYTYDTSNFFGAGNPDGAAAGAQAQASLEEAADFFSTMLTDTFSSIQTPADFHSSVGTGVATWQWQLVFPNPNSEVNTTLYDETIAIDEYRIYAGARSLSGNTLGIGGPGGYGLSWSVNGTFTSGEQLQYLAIKEAFFDSVETRGEPSGFSRWGGALTFDNDGSTNWHYDHTSSPSGGENDFFSVAIHELGHSFGLGASDDWDALVSGSSFTGSAATSEYGGPVPLYCNGSCAHWAEGTSSTVLGTSTIQEAVMDPTLTTGTRKLLTNLDAAALTDLGWSVNTPTFDPADFDSDGNIDGADFLIWQRGFGLTGQTDNSNGDADGNGTVDGLDLAAWNGLFGTSASAAGSAAVPEPTTGSLLALALAAATLSYRKRQTS